MYKSVNVYGFVYVPLGNCPSFLTTKALRTQMRNFVCESFIRFLKNYAYVMLFVVMPRHDDFFSLADF